MEKNRYVRSGVIVDLCGDVQLPSFVPDKGRTIEPHLDQSAQVGISKLVVGGAVVLVGLKNIALNGKHATVMGWDDLNMRYELQVDGLEERRLIKAENIEVRRSDATSELSTVNAGLDGDESRAGVANKPSEKQAWSSSFVVGSIAVVVLSISWAFVSSRSASLQPQT